VSRRTAQGQCKRRWWPGAEQQRSAAAHRHQPRHRHQRRRRPKGCASTWVACRRFVHSFQLAFIMLEGRNATGAASEGEQPLLKPWAQAGHRWQRPAWRRYLAMELWPSTIFRNRCWEATIANPTHLQLKCRRCGKQARRGVRWRKDPNGVSAGPKPSHVASRAANKQGVLGGRYRVPRRRRPWQCRQRCRRRHGASLRLACTIWTPFFYAPQQGTPHGMPMKSSSILLPLLLLLMDAGGGVHGRMLLEPPASPPTSATPFEVRSVGA